jgi:methanogenic corrinoid protein MtbC1
MPIVAQEAREEHSSAKPVEPMGSAHGIEGPARERGPHRQAHLLRTIEAEIIPRLMLAHRTLAADAEDGSGRTAPTATEVEAFARVVLERPASEARARVDALRDAGLALETILIELLGPTARRLGEMWEDDEVGFTEVTIGLSKLQQLVHELGELTHGPSEPSDPVGRVVLVPAPGEQHTFGMHIVAELFRRAGWTVLTEFSVTNDDLVSLVRDEQVDMVGFSVSSTRLLEPLTALVRELRAASRNPELVVMIGGAIDLSPHVTRVGACCCPRDAREALAELERRTARDGRSRAS